MDNLKEIEGKQVHDKNMPGSTTRRIWVRGPIIVGAGPSGLAVATCLKEKGIPSLILERAHCIASLWQLKTYDRLRLHLPKQFFQLPMMPFPSNFPTYPPKQQFLAYLEAYTHRFHLKPVFNNRVDGARFDHRSGLWQVKAATVAGSKDKEDDAEVVIKTEYVSQWLVVATGENAQEAVPEIQGIGRFGGPVVHTSSYKSGEDVGIRRITYEIDLSSFIYRS